MDFKRLTKLVFLALWIVIGVQLSRFESPTFDEPVHLRAAKEYSIGNFDFDPIEPPLIRRFVYFFAKDVPSARVVVVAATGMLLLPLVSNPLSAILLLTEANLVAHSHYFTTDAIASSLAVVASLLILAPQSPLLLTAIAVALALSSKVATMALIIPVLLIKVRSLGLKKIIFIGLFSFVFIWATYDFRSQIIFNHFDVSIPFGGYLRAVKENFLFAKRGQPIFFMGEINQYASVLKTPFTILTKTSIPLLFLAIWGVAQRKKAALPYLLIFFIVVGVNLIKPLNFGIRHLLSGSLALVLMASLVKPKSMISKISLALLVLWQVVGIVSSLPHPISYTNELVSSPQAIFSDSDFDWGQGLISLSQELRKKQIGEFQLAYFGNVDPKDYLGHYLRVKDANVVSDQPIRELNYDLPLVVSLTCYYQCGYNRDEVLKTKKAEIIAKSFYLFHD